MAKAELIGVQHHRDIKGKIADMIGAFFMIDNTESVHTRDGEMGLVVKTHVLKGEVVLFTQSGERTVRGSDVLDLDLPF